MAKASDIGKLTSEERLTIMDQAVEAAEEQDLDFDLVFTILLNAYVESKERQVETEAIQEDFGDEIPEDIDDGSYVRPEEEVWPDIPEDIDDGSYVRPEEEVWPDIPEDIDEEPAFDNAAMDIPEDIEEEMEQAEPAMSDEQRVTVRQQLKEYFQRKRDELLSKIGAIKGVTPGMIIDAKDGIITDSDRYFEGTYADAEVREFVGQLNANSRASYYDDLMLASDDELEAMRDSTVGLYAELAEEGLAEKDFWDKEDELHPEKDVWNMQHQPTLTFDNLVAMRGRSGRHMTGVTSPTGYGSDPLGFDEFYSEARERVGKGKSHTKNLFDQALSKIRENIEKVSHMTASEFRNFKVSQMTLSDEEKTFFDEQRSNVVRSYGLGDDEDSFTDERGYEGFGMNK